MCTVPCIRIAHAGRSGSLLAAAARHVGGDALVGVLVAVPAAAVEATPGVPGTVVARPVTVVPLVTVAEPADQSQRRGEG